MNPSFWLGAGGADSAEEVLWQDNERVVCRRWRDFANGGPHSVLVVLPVREHLTPSSLDRLTHEYELRDGLDDAWAARPLELVRERGQTMLVLKDPGGGNWEFLFPLANQGPAAERPRAASLR